jgi:3-methylfumaryl-CoA hydratase
MDGATDPLDIDRLKAWVGRSEICEDVVTPVPIKALSATLDRDDPPPRAGDPLPPLWHWLYFLPLHRQSEIGPDGHALRGGFLPPAPLPRRMWAGGRLTFGAPLRVGEAVRRTSRVADVSVKRGRTGALLFVLVRHEIEGAGGGSIVEEHDIVYREASAPGEAPPAPRPAPQGATWERTIVPDDVLLFRYSALTFNGHRIHYDRRHVTQVEGYLGLVVHGPLIATLLIDLLRRNVKGPVLSFSFRAVRPLFDIAPFSVCGAQKSAGEVALWARDADGFLAMEASAAIAAS